MAFSKEIKEEALVKSGRYCCICHEFSGRNVNVHHIIHESDGGPDTLDNAIVLCLRCHAEAGHYNLKHPLGIKYSPNELRRHRDDWWERSKTSFEGNEKKIASITTSYLSEYISSEIHKYRLLFIYKNEIDKTQEGYRIEIFVPEDIPVVAPDFKEFGMYLSNIRFKGFFFESTQRIFPGQVVSIIDNRIHFFEYHMDHALYFNNERHHWKLIWKFYSSNSPMIEGERSWDELHKF